MHVEPNQQNPTRSELKNKVERLKAGIAAAADFSTSIKQQIVDVLLWPHLPDLNRLHIREVAGYPLIPSDFQTGKPFQASAMFPPRKVTAVCQIRPGT